MTSTMWKNVAECNILSRASYGSEAWKLRKKENKYQESLEMWCLIKIGKIKCTEMVKNNVFLRRVNLKKFP